MVVEDKMHLRFSIMTDDIWIEMQYAMTKFQF